MRKTYHHQTFVQNKKKKSHQFIFSLQYGKKIREKKEN